MGNDAVMNLFNVLSFVVIIIPFLFFIVYIIFLIKDGKKMNDETMSNEDLSFKEALDFANKGFLIRRKSWVSGYFLYYVDQHNISIDKLNDAQVRNYIESRHPGWIKEITILPHLDAVSMNATGVLITTSAKLHPEDEKANDWEFILTDDVINGFEGAVTKLSDLKEE